MPCRLYLYVCHHGSIPPREKIGPLSYLEEWAIAVHGMYESLWFDGFLFGMSLVESSFPTDTGGKDPFMWIAKPSTFVKYEIKFVEENVKNNKIYIYIYFCHHI